MLHVQDIGEFGPVMTMAENLRQKDVILDWDFFLKSKSFLFIYILQTKLLFHYPVLNMTGFTYPKSNLYKVYALQNDISL